MEHFQCTGDSGLNMKAQEMKASMRSAVTESTSTETTAASTRPPHLVNLEFFAPEPNLVSAGTAVATSTSVATSMPDSTTTAAGAVVTSNTGAIRAFGEVSPHHVGHVVAEYLAPTNASSVGLKHQNSELMTSAPKVTAAASACTCTAAKAAAISNTGSSGPINAIIGAISATALAQNFHSPHSPKAHHYVLNSKTTNMIIN